jgi:two-component system, sporulation sensor kinase D
MSYIRETFIFVFMKIFSKILLLKRVTILISIVIVTSILWNTYTFFQKFKYQERIRMEILAEAQKELSNANLDSNISLPDKIITTNNSIPLILVDEKGEIIYANNLDSYES